MGMSEALRVWTREEVLALPDDGNRHELVDGELLVSPSPRRIHQLTVLRLYDRIWPYVREQRVGSVMLAPADLDLHSGQLLQPDLYVVPMNADGKEAVEWSDQGIPLLIAEVTSPSTARYDRITKRRRFQRSRVAEYWIVDADARAIERWTPDDSRPTVLDDRIEWRPLDSVGPLVIDLDAYFAEVWGENEGMGNRE